MSPRHGAWIFLCRRPDGETAHRMTHHHRIGGRGRKHRIGIAVERDRVDRRRVVAVAGQINRTGAVAQFLQRRDQIAPAPRAVARAVDQKDVRHGQRFAKTR